MCSPRLGGSLAPPSSCCAHRATLGFGRAKDEGGDLLWLVDLHVGACIGQQRKPHVREQVAKPAGNARIQVPIARTEYNPDRAWKRACLSEHSTPRVEGVVQVFVQPPERLVRRHELAAIFLIADEPADLPAKKPPVGGGNSPGDEARKRP